MSHFWDVMGIPLEACGATLVLFLPYVLWPVYGWWIYQRIDNVRARKMMRAQALEEKRWAERLQNDIEQWDGVVPDDILDKPYRL